jgi:hypothetical protein
MKPLLALTFLLFASQAFAEPDGSDAEAVVKKELLSPLAAKDRARQRFSRSVLPATARRVRIPDATPRTDAQGHTFVAFTVDAHHGWEDADDEDVKPKDKGWIKNVFEGCVYVDSKEIFVKKGDDYRPAELLLGKKTQVAAAHICRPGQGKLAAK